MFPRLFNTRMDSSMRREAIYPDVLRSIVGPAHDAVTMTVCRPGDFLLREHQGASQLCFLLDGVAYGYESGLDGKREVCGVYTPGDILNLGNVFLGKAGCEVRALMQSRAAFLQREFLLDRLREEPNISAALLRTAIDEAALLRRWFVNIANQNADVRLAHFICEMYTRLDAKGLTFPAKDRIEVPFPFTQSLVSEITGMSIVHVNRTLKRLRRGGVLGLRKNILTLYDLGELAKVAGFDADYLNLKPEPTYPML